MPDRFRVNLTRRALAGIEQIHGYIAQYSPQNAPATVANLLDAIDGLQLFPHRYPVYNGKRQPSQSVRRMPVPPFLVYYRVNDSAKSVEIVAVLHGAQRQPRRF